MTYTFSLQIKYVLCLTKIGVCYRSYHFHNFCLKMFYVFWVQWHIIFVYVLQAEIVKYWSAMMWPLICQSKSLHFECFVVLCLVVVLKSWPKYWLSSLQFCMVFPSLPSDSRWDITWNFATTATFHIVRSLLNTLVDPKWLCCDTLHHYGWVVSSPTFCLVVIGWYIFSKTSCTDWNLVLFSIHIAILPL